jgi:hypothetical protein
MNSKGVKSFFSVLCGLSAIAMFYACANIGTPNGGPYDEQPPRFVSSTPILGQTNFKGNKIEILFDELIQLDNPSENVIVTPPQMIQPIIKGRGKKVLIELNDTLIENTTYTIDFTTALGDNNEKNLLENFTFAFSTGDVIDSLEVSGLLLNAENLEPMPGVTIGIHSNLEDSVFNTVPFVRTSRTNDKGRFTIRNIAEGTYRIFALVDTDRNYTFNQPTEAIAFNDSIIIPAFEFTERRDTIWHDSITVDTVLTVPYTRFTPDDIRLYLFKENFQRQYLLRSERTEENKGVVRFNAPLDYIPELKPLNFTPSDDNWYFVQLTDDDATANYWFTDTTLFAKDTLSYSINYLRSDSLNILREQTDTLAFTMRRRPDNRKKNKDSEEEKIEFLNMDIRASGTIEVYDTIKIKFTEPVLEINKDIIVMEQKVDTLWNPVSDFELLADPKDALGFLVQRKWKYGEEYRLKIDSASITSLYGKWNKKHESDFRIKKDDEYGHLYINISGIEGTAFVELLNSGDAPVRKAPVKDGGVLFMNLKPDKYYARIIVDDNDNGIWDTGLYIEKRQPEKVYYYPKMFEVMRNWEMEETWDVLSTPVEKQKPIEITKNKPKEQTNKKRNHRDESNQSRSSSTPSTGIGNRF